MAFFVSPEFVCGVVSTRVFKNWTLTDLVCICVYVGELHGFVSSLIAKQPPRVQMNRKVGWLTNPSVLAMAYVVVVLKLLFYLDDITEKYVDCQSLLDANLTFLSSVKRPQFSQWYAIASYSISAGCCYCDKQKFQSIVDAIC